MQALSQSFRQAGRCGFFTQHLRLVGEIACGTGACEKAAGRASLTVNPVQWSQLILPTCQAQAATFSSGAIVQPHQRLGSQGERPRANSQTAGLARFISSGGEGGSSSDSSENDISSKSGGDGSDGRQGTVADMDDAAYDRLVSEFAGEGEDIDLQEALQYKGELHAYDYDAIDRAVEEGGLEDSLPFAAGLVDKRLEEIKSSSKKKQKFLLQQLLSGDELLAEEGGAEEELEVGYGGHPGKDDTGLGTFRMKVVDINRTCKGTRAGGMWRFSAMVVVGNGQGVLGHGSGKAGDVNAAVKKAYARALKNLTYVHRYRQQTLYGPATTKYGKVKVTVYPKGAGHGICASYLMHDICKLAGLDDIGVKVHGSRNSRNSVKALFAAFESVRDPREAALAQGKMVVERAVGNVHALVA